MGRPDRLDQHVRMLQQIVVNDAFDFSALLWSTLGSARRPQGHRCDGDATQRQRPDRHAEQHDKGTPLRKGTDKREAPA